MKRQQKAVCTIGLIAVNIAVFLFLSIIGDTEDGIFMLNHGACFAPYVLEEHEYYRIFTSMFLHFGFPHLIQNMFMLAVLGWNLELEVGRIKFILIYLISGIGGNVISLCFSGLDTSYKISAGASGAIFGLMGALLYVVLLSRNYTGRISSGGMIVMVVLSVYLGLSDDSVDSFAHLGGVACGFVCAFLLSLLPASRKKSIWGA